jgi:prepilin-type N-terminal cleavage/methylation domain-containing protein
MEQMMTSAALVASSRDRRASFGFTLLELMVVMAIIALLAGLGLPLIFRAYRNGQKVRQAADLQAISVGLEAFRQDFGDYPRVDIDNTGFAVLGKSLMGPWGNGHNDALSTPTTPVLDPLDPPAYAGGKQYKPGDCVRQPSTVDQPTYVCIKTTTTAPGGGPDWVQYDVNDGKDGPGIHTARGTKTWGPYLQIDKFKMQGIAILDMNDHPIAYFPARPKKPDIHQPGQYIAQGGQAMYNANNNLSLFLRDADMGIVPGGSGETLAAHAADALKRLQSMLGDVSNGTGGAPDGGINTNESAKCELPFILWSAGQDGFFGPQYYPGNPLPITFSESDIQKCDDVTNFK